MGFCGLGFSLGYIGVSVFIDVKLVVGGFDLFLKEGNVVVL